MPSSLDTPSVFCPGQPFAMNGVGLVAEAREVVRQFPRKILIQLESHFVRMGTIRSSCASSAA
jgi:hypothetical protein